MITRRETTLFALAFTLLSANLCAEARVMSINFDLAASEDGHTKPVPSEALDNDIIETWGKTEAEGLPFVVTIAKNEEHFSTID